MSARAVPPRLLWWLAAGFGVWCSALVFLYALHAIGCVFAWRAGALRLTLAVVFLAHLIVAGWIWRNVAKSVPERYADAEDYADAHRDRTARACSCGKAHRGQAQKSRE